MNKQQSNIPRFIMAGILAVIIAVMWVNNKNKAEEASKRTGMEIPSSNKIY